MGAGDLVLNGMPHPSATAEDMPIDKWVDKLFCRMITSKAWPLHQTNVDVVTLGKPSHVAISRSTSVAQRMSHGTSHARAVRTAVKDLAVESPGGQQQQRFAEHEMLLPRRNTILGTAALAATASVWALWLPRSARAAETAGATAVNMKQIDFKSFSLQVPPQYEEADMTNLPAPVTLQFRDTTGRFSRDSITLFKTPVEDKESLTVKQNDKK